MDWKLELWRGNKSLVHFSKVMTSMRNWKSGVSQIVCAKLQKIDLLESIKLRIVYFNVFKFRDKILYLKMKK